MPNESLVARHCKPWKIPFPWHKLSNRMRLRRAEASLECGGGERCNESETADGVLISLPQGRHNTFCNGSHAFAKGVTNHSDSEHGGHYPTTCMARVKQVKRRPTLAWYLCHLCIRLAVVRLPQTSNESSPWAPSINRSATSRRPGTRS